jgi:isoquinoline 1-oxidoreductase beta subunit
VERVVAAVDPGVAINPSSVRAQIEGCIADAVATSLKSEITIDRGGVVQSGWGDLGWLRIDEMPQVDVHIVEGQSSSVAGMGELGFPSVSPAICNAVFAATGRRVESLPIRAEDLAGWAGQVDPEPTATAVPPSPTDTPEPEPEPLNKVFLPNLGTGRD